MPEDRSLRQGRAQARTWRRERDSNPRYPFRVQRFSRPPPSTTRPSLRGISLIVSDRADGLAGAVALADRVIPTRHLGRRRPSWRLPPGLRAGAAPAELVGGGRPQPCRPNKRSHEHDQTHHRSLRRDGPGGPHGVRAIASAACFAGIDVVRDRHGHRLSQGMGRDGRHVEVRPGVAAGRETGSSPGTSWPTSRARTTA